MSFELFVYTFLNHFLTNFKFNCNIKTYTGCFSNEIKHFSALFHTSFHTFLRFPPTPFAPFWPFCYTLLHFITLCYTSPYYTFPHFSTLLGASMRFIALYNFIALYKKILHFFKSVKKCKEM